MIGSFKKSQVGTVIEGNAIFTHLFFMRISLWISRLPLALFRQGINFIIELFLPKPTNWVELGSGLFGSGLLGSGLLIWKKISIHELEGKARIRPDILRVVLSPYVQYCPCEASVIQAYHFGKKDFDLGVGGECQDTSRHFEGSFGSIRTILPNVRPRRKKWAKNQNLDERN